MNPSSNILNSFKTINPYKQYSNIREKSPIYRISTSKWMIMRYDDAVSILQNPNVTHWGQDLGTQNSLFQGREDLMIKTFYAFAPDMDSPYRKLVLHGLASKNIQFGKEKMINSANGVLENCIIKGKFELVGDLIHRYTFETICRIIGIQSDDIQELMDITSNLKDSYIKLISSNFQTTNPAEEKFINFFRKFLVKKEKLQGADLSSALIDACRHNGETDNFILSLLIFILYAGHDNMMNFLSIGFLTLINNKSIFNQLKIQPNLISEAANELLRYDAPVQFLTMYTKKDIIIKNTKITEGSQIYICIGSANRDPLKFNSPDEIIIDRNPQHLSFGFGSYRCIGARLAELQSTTFFEAIINLLKIENLSISNTKWKEDQNLQRGLTSSIVTLK